MKRILFYASLLVLLSAAKWMPFSATDVAQLHPVQVIRLQSTAQGVQLQTDTGCSGRGEGVQAALEDLKRSASGSIFLETAEYLLVDFPAVRFLPEMIPILRPSCKVCLEFGESDLKTVAAFLDTHRPGITITDYRAGERYLPLLTIEGGRMRLEQ